MQVRCTRPIQGSSPYLWPPPSSDGAPLPSRVPPDSEAGLLESGTPEYIAGFVSRYSCGAWVYARTSATAFFRALLSLNQSNSKLTTAISSGAPILTPIATSWFAGHPAFVPELCPAALQTAVDVAVFVAVPEAVPVALKAEAAVVELESTALAAILISLP